jgi:hypothetical protein
MTTRHLGRVPGGAPPEWVESFEAAGLGCRGESANDAYLAH